MAGARELVQRSSSLGVISSHGTLLSELRGLSRVAGWQVLVSGYA